MRKTIDGVNTDAEIDLLPEMGTSGFKNLPAGDPPRKSGPIILLASFSVYLLFSPAGTERLWSLIA